MNRVKQFLAVWVMFCLLMQILIPADAFAMGKGDETTLAVSVSSMDEAVYAVSENGEVISDAPENEIESDTEMGSVSGDEITPDAVKILFVGNSFTKYHKNEENCSVPLQLQELGRLTNKEIYVDCVANGLSRLQYYAGMSMKYKSYYYQLQAKLAEEDWDYVILQEQSIIPGFSSDSEMAPALASLQRIIKKACPQAQILLYMTHGFEYAGNENRTPVHTAELQMRVGAGYMHMGSKYGIDVVPVGMQFGRAQNLYSNQQFLSKDGKHPSVLGYFLAACCFYQKLFGNLPDLDAGRLKTITISQSVEKGLAVLVRDPVLTLNCEPQEYMLIGEMGNMHVLDSTLPVTYQSLDKNVATVDTQGNIKAVAKGVAVLVAQAADGRQGFCSVYVSRMLSFGRKQYEAGLGDRICILPEYSSDAMEWSSSNTEVAEVDGDGKIHTKKLGKTTIRVRDLNNPESEASFVLCVTLHTPENLKCRVQTGKLQKNGKRITNKLTWDGINGTVRYWIYRSNRRNTGYELIGKTKSPVYRDRTAKVGQVYYYKVAAAGRYGRNASDLSEYVTSSTAQAKIQKVNVQKKKATAVISWKKIKGATTYIIYRKQGKHAYRRVGTVPVSENMCSFTDRTRKKGKQYVYKVVAL